MSSSSTWSICPSCACIVAHEIKHAVWHATLAAQFGLPGTIGKGDHWGGTGVIVLPEVTEPEQQQMVASRAVLQAIVATSGADHPDAAPYEQPEGAHDAYKLGAVIAWTDGTFHRSRHPFNVWPPPEAPQWWERVWPDGDGGWTPTDPSGLIPDWDPAATYVRPDPPAVLRVRRHGRVYRLTHVVSSPGWDPADPNMWNVWVLDPA